jgi:hypothetical protein
MTDANEQAESAQPPERRTRRTILKLLGVGGAVGGYLAAFAPEATAATAGGRSRNLPKLKYEPLGSVAPAVGLMATNAEINRAHADLTRAGLTFSKAEQGRVVTLSGAPVAQSWAGQYELSESRSLVACHLAFQAGSTSTYAITSERLADGSTRSEGWAISPQTNTLIRRYVNDLSADRTSLRVQDLVEDKTWAFTSSAQPDSIGCDFCLFICNTALGIGCSAGVAAICGAGCGPTGPACWIPCSIIVGAVCGSAAFFGCIDTCTALGYC